MYLSESLGAGNAEGFPLKGISASRRAQKRNDILGSLDDPATTSTVRSAEQP